MCCCAHSDVDECAVSSDDCQQVCTNNDGGYSCSCRSGYNLTEDMKTCYSKSYYASVS